MENTHFTASRTNQILMEALMRGYSGRPEGTKKMKSGGEGSWRGERAALFLRARIILFFSFFSSLFFFFFAASRRCIPAYIRLTSVFRPAETTIVIIPRRDFRNFILFFSPSLGRLFANSCFPLSVDESFLGRVHRGMLIIMGT